MSANTAALRVYYCYDKEDEKLAEELTKHLSPLKRQRKLTIWLDVNIQAGSDRELEVQKHLKEADLILLLISPSFMGSDYCQNFQLAPALSHYEAGKVEIIPILLRPALWEESPIKRLPHILPTSQLPVTLWPNRDEAFWNIASAIRDLIQDKLSYNPTVPANDITLLDQLGEPVFAKQCPQCGTSNRIGAKFCRNDGVDLMANHMIVTPKPMPPLHTKETWVKEGQLCYEQKLYAHALVAYDQALLLDPYYAAAYFYKGHVLYTLGQYNAALTAYEQAIRFNPDSSAAHSHKGDTLRHLGHYSKALVAYDQALLSGPPEIRAHAYNGKGRVLYHSKKFSEALIAYEQASLLNPNYAEPYVLKGIVFYDLKQYREALAAYERAIQIDPHYTAPYFYKGNILFDLQCYAEALAAYEQALQIDPLYVAAYYGKGNVCIALGFEREAKEAFEKAASLTSPSHQGRTTRKS